MLLWFVLLAGGDIWIPRARRCPCMNLKVTITAWQAASSYFRIKWLLRLLHCTNMLMSQMVKTCSWKLVRDIFRILDIWQSTSLLQYSWVPLRCLQLAEGVVYLHSQNPIVVHRDLKALWRDMSDIVTYSQVWWINEWSPGSPWICLRKMPTCAFCSEPECGPGPELEYQTLRLWPHRVHGPRLSVPQKCAEHLQHQQVWITLNMTLVWLDHGLWQYHFLIWFCDSICALHSPRKERISPRRIMVDRLATWLQRLPSDAFPLPSCSIFQCMILLRLGTLFCSFWFTDCWNPIHVCIENTAWNLYFSLVPEYRTSIAKYTEHKDTKCRVHHGSGMLAAFVLHFFD